MIRNSFLRYSALADACDYSIGELRRNDNRNREVIEYDI